MTSGRLVIQEVVEHEQGLEHAAIALLSSVESGLTRVAWRCAVAKVLDAQTGRVPLLSAAEGKLDCSY